MQNRSLRNMLHILMGLSWLAQSVLLAPPAAALTSSPPALRTYPCDGQILDFGGGNQGWVADDYSRAYGRVEPDAKLYIAGNQSVKSPAMKLNLDRGHESAQFYVDLYNTTPKCAGGLSTEALWWEPGSVLSLWILAPSGTRGDPENPNGLHLYAVDDKGKTLYGTWQTIRENSWFEVTLRLGGGNPACGDLDPEFNFSRIRKLGINIALNTKDGVFPIKNSLQLYSMRINSSLLPLPSASHLYSFDEWTNENVFPRWGVVRDKVWGAEAFKTAETREGALIIDADFQAENQDDPDRKGVMNIIFAPNLNLGDPTQGAHFISLDIKFDAPPDFAKPYDCPFTLKFWAFDSGKQIQFDSSDVNVGSGEWTRVAFWLRDLLPSTPGAYSGDRLDPSQIGKIGFQIYDGIDGYEYQGRIWIDNVAIGSKDPLLETPSLSFVKTEGSHFTLDDKRFRFVGANAEYLPYRSDVIVEDVLNRAQSMGIRVIRTWGFGEGCEDYNLKSCQELSPYFQPQAGMYNQSAFEHFDRIVYEAGQRNIRLIVPLANNWHEYGGIPRYVCWVTQPGHDSECNTKSMSDELHDTFYTNPTIKIWYRDYVRHFVTHVNTITGIRYADDPTIMAWELINEPRARSDPSGRTLHTWTVEMSAYLATLAPNQLIGSGEEGWYIMPQEKADQFKGWQVFDKNYWHYGVNWADASCIDSWGSNGTDFLSNHSSMPRTVEWQDQVGKASSTTPVRSEQRDGVPEVDFTGIHLYLSPSETGLSYAPYCYYYGLDSLCSSPYDTTIYDSTTDRNLDFNNPVHQAREWIAQHVNTAHAELAKPFILEEFNFPVLPTDPSEGQHNRAGEGFQVTPDERARLFRQYLDLSYDLDVDGVLFWNMGYEGFMQQSWGEIEALRNWKSEIAEAVAIDEFNRIRLDYDPVLHPKTSIELSEPQVDWLRAEGNQVLVDLINQGGAKEVVIEVKFAGDTIPRSKSFQIQPGENKISLDELFAPVQKLQSNVQCPQPKEEPPLVTLVKITIQHYTSAGTVVFKFYTIFNNKYVIYPGDPVEDVIRTETSRWAQEIGSVPPSVKINPAITCNKRIHTNQIVDGTLPIEFNFVGSIEHPDGYYYRYSITGPKGQSETDLVSNRWKQTGQISVYANAIGKYEVKIAAEGERFDEEKNFENPAADSCYFEVVNTSLFDITRIQVDNQEIEPTADIYKPKSLFATWQRDVEVWLDEKEGMSANYKVGCQLLQAKTVIDRQIFPCQGALLESISAKGYHVPIAGQLSPGKYELQLWSVDEKAVKSEPTSVNFEIPIPWGMYVILCSLLLLVFFIWRVRMHRKSPEKRTVV